MASHQPSARTSAVGMAASTIVLSSRATAPISRSVMLRSMVRRRAVDSANTWASQKTIVVTTTAISTSDTA